MVSLFVSNPCGSAVESSGSGQGEAYMYISSGGRVTFDPKQVAYPGEAHALRDHILVGPLWEGYHESRRCSRNTHPESYITKYTSIRRLRDISRRPCSDAASVGMPYMAAVLVLRKRYLSCGKHQSHPSVRALPLDRRGSGLSKEWWFRVLCWRFGAGRCGLGCRV